MAFWSGTRLFQTATVCRIITKSMIMTIGSTANQWESQNPAITEGGPEKSFFVKFLVGWRPLSNAALNWYWLAAMLLNNGTPIARLYYIETQEQDKRTLYLRMAWLNREPCHQQQWHSPRLHYLCSHSEHYTPVALLIRWIEFNHSMDK